MRAATVGQRSNATLSTRQRCDTRVAMPNRERLRDAAADSVADDARALDAQLIEHLDDALGVRAATSTARSSGRSLRP